jgi:ribosomal protein S18 acetylase RimI-like enzyme
MSTYLLDLRVDVTIRSATAADLRTICDIHTDAFPGFFMTLLGKKFLARYYQTVLDAPQGICLVALDDKAVPAGFVAGFVDVGAFYHLLRQRKFSLGLSVASHLVTHPWLIVRLMQTLSRVRTAANPVANTKETAELSSIGVRRDAEGRGLGKELVLAFVAEAHQMRASSVLLTTDAKNNESVNRFYTRLGFLLTHEFVAPGKRPMNEYKLKLDPDVAWAPPRRND